MNTLLVLIAVTGLTVLGDYFNKLASGHANGLMTVTFIAGATLYALPAVGWFFLMRSHSLAAIGIFYSASTILLMAALGFFVFKEPFGLRELVGLSLAIASVVVVSGEG